jgi:glycosyltransferase involved in cell wall biosynthesis
MPGCEDVVRDGWSGRLVKPRAPRDLAAAIIDLLSDRAASRAMGARAAEVVRNQFGLDRVAEHTLDVYRRLLAPAPSLCPSSGATTRDVVTG